MKPLPALLLLVAALVLFAVSSAHAAELEWNQQRVAALAQDLIEPLEALRADLESRPPVPEKEEARAAVVNDVERLRSRPFDMHVYVDRAQRTIIQLARYYGASPDSDAGLHR